MKEIQPQQIWNEEKMEGLKKLIQKQKLIDMMEQDEQLGLYEETKCYCGHTTTCDCGPEETKQECMITKIMQMDAEMAYDSLPKQDKIMERFIENAKQETLEEAAERFAEKYKGEEQDSWYDFIEGAKWQMERSYSEEEVYNIVEQAIKENSTNQLHFFDGGYSNPIYTNLKEWFEQFKKK